MGSFGNSQSNCAWDLIILRGPSHRKFGPKGTRGDQRLFRSSVVVKMIVEPTGSVPSVNNLLSQAAETAAAQPAADGKPSWMNVTLRSHKDYDGQFHKEFGNKGTRKAQFNQPSRGRQTVPDERDLKVSRR